MKHFQIRIYDAKRKNKPSGFRVKQVGANGEPDNTSQVLDTPQAVYKNILSVINGVMKAISSATRTCKQADLKDISGIVDMTASQRFTKSGYAMPKPKK